MLAPYIAAEAIRALAANDAKTRGRLVAGCPTLGPGVRRGMERMGTTSKAGDGREAKP